MKRWLIAMIGGLLCCAGTTRAAEKDRVEWRTDYDAARKESAEKNLPIFLEFTTDDCVHCKRLEAGPFRDPALMSLLNERFIPLRLEAKLAPKLAQALRIQVYPTMIVASTEGKIIGFLEGFMETKPLSEHLDRCLALSPPDAMTRDFQEASKAITAGEYAKAIALLKTITQDGKERPVQTKARQALQEIEQQAAGHLLRAKQLQDKGQTNEAREAVTALASQYAGTQTATEGTKLLAKWADDPELRTNPRAHRSRDLLAQAREALKAEKYHEVLDLCEILESTYKDTPEAQQGILLANEIRSNPEKLAKACDHLNERLALMYATLGETMLKKGERELAALHYERAVRTAPASATARDAQAKLASLAVKTFGAPVKFQKPEREKKD